MIPKNSITVFEYNIYSGFEWLTTLPEWRLYGVHDCGLLMDMEHLVDLKLAGEAWSSLDRLDYDTV
jgi:hypothetical protein